MGLDVQREIGILKYAWMEKETYVSWLWELLVTERFMEGCVDVVVQMLRDMKFLFHWVIGGRLMIHPHTSGTKREAMERSLCY